jgi:hypothetical protein
MNFRIVAQRPVAYLTQSVGAASRWDSIRADLAQRLPPTANDGRCYNRALALLDFLNVRASKKVVLHVAFDGLFTPNGRDGFDCQHVAAILKDGYQNTQFPDGRAVPLRAIDRVIDQDYPGTNDLSFGEWHRLYQSLPLRVVTAGPSTRALRGEPVGRAPLDGFNSAVRTTR